MKRLLLLALILAACSSAPAPTEISSCTWKAESQVAFLPSFKCLDAGPTPSGMPKVAIVNVWGSWCTPCRREIPFFVTLDRRYDVTIIGVDVDEPNLGVGQKFASASGMTWPNLFDTNGRSTEVFGPGVPVTWFIKDGKVAYKKIGAWKSFKQLESKAREFGMIR